MKGFGGRITCFPVGFGQLHMDGRAIEELIFGKTTLVFLRGRNGRQDNQKYCNQPKFHISHATHKSGTAERDR